MLTQADWAEITQLHGPECMPDKARQSRHGGTLPRLVE